MKRVKQPKPVVLENAECPRCGGDVAVLGDGTPVCTVGGCTGLRVEPAMVPAASLRAAGEGDSRG